MNYQKKRIYSRVATLSCYVGLLTILVMNAFVYRLENVNPWPIAIISVLPLLFFAKGVIKQNLRQLSWLCFVLLVYFVLTVFTWQPQSIWTALFIIGLFISAMLHIRWHNRAKGL